MIKSLTKKTLHKVGYDINRKGNLHKLKSIPQAPSSGVIIEFVGPSGIGKTTFFQRIKDEYKHTWLFKDDLAHVHELDDSFKLLSKQEEQVVSQVMDLAYQSLIKDDLSLPVRDGIYRFLTKEMKTDIFFRKANFGKGLLSEGGLLLNFCDELVSVRTGASPDLLLTMNNLFRKRHVVNFMASDHYILENLKKRKKETPGAGNDWIGNLGLQKAHDMIKRYNESNLRLVHLAVSLGCRVIEIDAEASFEEKKNLFENFVPTVINKRHEDTEKTSTRSPMEQLET